MMLTIDVDVIQPALPGLEPGDTRCPSCRAGLRQRYYPDFPGDAYLVCLGCGSEGWQTAAEGVQWYRGVPRGGG